MSSSSHVRHRSSLRFEIDAHAGARLAHLDFGRGEVLTDASVHPSNWGATSWPSPQAIWNWPPPPFLDGLEWRVREQGEDFVEFESPRGEVGETCVVMSKRFSVSAASTPHLCTRHAMRCEGEASGELPCMASWEISRVPGGGVSFFSRGAFALTPIGPHAPLVGKAVDDCLVFEHAELFQGKSAKVHAHCGGCFLAHIDAAGTRMLLALFEPISAQALAEGEGNVELFYNECGGYIELEVQGAAVEMREGAVASLEVHWFEFDLPSNLATLAQRVAWGRARAQELARELSLVLVLRA